MGSQESEVFLENRSGVRLQTAGLKSFAAEVRKALRLKGGLAVLLCNDAEIRKMNAAFRGKDYATDVLSFPSDMRGHIGDLAISAQMAARNAARLKLSRAEELKILILHGMLHLAGFDHEADEGEMAAKESALRKRFGLSESLIERANGAGKKARVRSRKR
jgi:probable rRNA maturation factor